MAVDLENNRVYWVNVGSATVQFLDVASRKVSTLPLGAAARPAALDVYGGEVFWADAEAGTLTACNATDGADPRLLLNNTSNAFLQYILLSTVQKTFHCNVTSLAVIPINISLLYQYDYKI